MSMNMNLDYPGKEPEEDILAPGDSATFVEVLRGGTTRLTSFEGEPWENQLVFADNLKALRTFLRNPIIRGRVRLVYIDPPFAANHDWKGGGPRVATVSSSESDEVAYQDRLTGSEYLEFLRKRLILLREVIAENGSIYVHIDAKMGHYVKVLMDEIFGEEHFVNDIARVKCNPKNFERRGYGNVKDMILFYSNSDDFLWNGSTEPYTPEDIERLFPRVDEEGRRYTTTPLHAPGETKNGPTGQPWKRLSPPPGRHWRYAPEELSRLDDRGLIEWSKTGNPRKMVYADELIQKEKKVQDIWTFKDPAYPKYPTEKNLDLLLRIIRASSSPSDIVMDCFAGSGTTLRAAERLGRRWIGVDNSRIAIQTTVKRLLKARNSSPFKVIRDKNLSLNLESTSISQP